MNDYKINITFTSHCSNSDLNNKDLIKSINKFVKSNFWNVKELNLIVKKQYKNNNLLNKPGFRNAFLQAYNQNKGA